MQTKYAGYDEDDVYGDVPSLESIERAETLADRIQDEREQRELDDAPDKINSAIARLRDLGVWA